jgi:hypothetical protein
MTVAPPAACVLSLHPARQAKLQQPDFSAIELGAPTGNPAGAVGENLTSRPPSLAGNSNYNAGAAPGPYPSRANSMRSSLSGVSLASGLGGVLGAGGGMAAGAPGGGGRGRPGGASPGPGGGGLTPSPHFACPMPLENDAYFPSVGGIVRVAGTVRGRL